MIFFSYYSYEPLLIAITRHAKNGALGTVCASQWILNHIVWWDVWVACVRHGAYAVRRSAAKKSSLSMQVHPREIACTCDHFGMHATYVRLTLMLPDYFTLIFFSHALIFYFKHVTSFYSYYVCVRRFCFVFMDILFLLPLPPWQICNTMRDVTWWSDQICGPLPSLKRCLMLVQTKWRAFCVYSFFCSFFSELHIDAVEKASLRQSTLTYINGWVRRKVRFSPSKIKSSCKRRTS